MRAIILDEEPQSRRRGLLSIYIYMDRGSAGDNTHTATTSSSAQTNTVIGVDYTSFAVDGQFDPAGVVDAFLPSFPAMPAGFPWQDRSYFHASLPPLPPPATTQAFYGADLYSRRLGAAFAYDGGYGGPLGLASDPIGLAGLYMAGGGGAGGGEALLRGGGGLSSSSLSPFGELGKMTAQEIMDAKALAASKSHSEAERRRRERINTHFVKLRSLLPSTTKVSRPPPLIPIEKGDQRRRREAGRGAKSLQRSCTDKASLLAEVIQHVKELKRQTSEIVDDSNHHLLPTESDELTVDATSDDDGRLLVTASLCCEDRSDLLPEVIKALKALRLRTIKAEITTLGGRLKNVLVITADDPLAADSTPDKHPQQCSVSSIQDALKAVMERTTSSAEEPAASAAVKRQRTADLSSILEHRSI
ncbi:Transcription factor bHLH30 [Platanthera zijinensis]|uniref:Transcription factor bHLH30 n=1 Tax=Platanthera zijinensis TaxID=2320716 RepID=A0AAP0G755_9ASPA